MAPITQSGAVLGVGSGEPDPDRLSTTRFGLLQVGRLHLVPDGLCGADLGNSKCPAAHAV